MINLGKKALVLVLAMFCVVTLKAQQDIMKAKISTVMFQGTYAFQGPGADTRDLYGNNSTVGGGIYYKTKSNWMFGINGNYIFSENVDIARKDLMGCILTENSELITGDGIYGSYSLFERGCHFQAKVTKIFNILAPNPNCGFFISAGVGYLQNRIKIEFSSYISTPTNLAGDYKYGYDRMRGGFAYSGEIGYLFLSNTRIFNFSLSFEVIQANTHAMRDYDFNLMGKGPSNFTDRFYGIRVAIYIPTYKRMPAEYYYD